MMYNRSSGVLLHPTSLPSPDGIGDLGPEAYKWIDDLSACGCGLWQILPMVPTGYGDSPYQGLSAFAGNPNLICASFLLEDNLLSIKDIYDRPSFPDDLVDYGQVITWKKTLLKRAYDHFIKQPEHKLLGLYQNFAQANAAWLHNFSLFMAIKEANQNRPWNEWPDQLKLRNPDALEAFTNSHKEEIAQHQFYQFLFHRQWTNLHQYAQNKGIKIIGDVPIFMAFDSAEVWANPDLFHLDEERNPTVVAGVPPDYFSPTGQLWGNPLYRWDVHAKSDYCWWKERFKKTFEQVDIIRMDHFRGFAGYWEIPAGMPTAEIGQWVKGPGIQLFHSIEKQLGKLPIIAEDLGVVTDDVIHLREALAYPGMKVLQFAFSDGPKNNFLPHYYDKNWVVYTGTHDNDTTLGWFITREGDERQFCLDYLNASEETIVWDMIRAIWASVAIFAITPMQDLLSLDSQARMNYPGRMNDNWKWRMKLDSFTTSIKDRIYQFNYLYNRLSQ